MYLSQTQKVAQISACRCTIKGQLLKKLIIQVIKEETALKSFFSPRIYFEDFRKKYSVIYIADIICLKKNANYREGY